MTPKPVAHLVGSVPLDSAEAVFRHVAGSLGDRVRSIPDGETGDRIGWIRHLEEKLAANAALEPDPDCAPFALRQWDGELLRNIEWLRVRPQTNLDDVRFETGYADAAIESFAVFERLQRGGIIPPYVRFQVSLPTPMAAAYHYISPASRQDFVEAYQSSLLGEVERITDHVPGEQLAIQWDVCQEVLVVEDYYPDRPDDFREQIFSQLASLGDAIPSPVDLGYHLCYGSPRDEHLVQPQDMAILVEIAQAIVNRVCRRVEWLHMPVPKERRDDAYFAPLDGLDLPGDTALYLGLVHHGDASGNQARYEAAAAHIDIDGVASECGWGRADPQLVPGLLAAHRELLDIA
jgi:hypothetical protein